MKTLLSFLYPFNQSVNLKRSIRNSEMVNSSHLVIGKMTLISALGWNLTDRSGPCGLGEIVSIVLHFLSGTKLPSLLQTHIFISFSLLLNSKTKTTIALSFDIFQQIVHSTKLD